MDLNPYFPFQEIPRDLCPLNPALRHSFLRVQGKDMTGKDMTGSDRRGKDMTEGMTGMTGYNFSWGRA